MSSLEAHIIACNQRRIDEKNSQMKSIHIQSILSVIGTIVVIGLVVNIRFSLHCYQSVLLVMIICREALSQRVARETSNSQGSNRIASKQIKACPYQTKGIDFRSDSWFILYWWMIIRDFEFNKTQTTLSHSYFMFVLEFYCDIERFVNLHYQSTLRNDKLELIMLEISCIRRSRSTRKTLFLLSISIMCVSIQIHCV